MFEYASPKKGIDKDTIKTGLIIALASIVGIGVVFTLLYYAAKVG